jgi:hypothetical protein
MELRRHFTEIQAKRHKLLVGSWTACEVQTVPIITKPVPSIQS